MRHNTLFRSRVARLTILVVCPVAFGAFGALQASAQTTSYAPTLDTYVSSAKPATSFGGSQTLYATSSTYASFVRFNLSALTKSGATVNTVTFSPYVTFTSGTAPAVSIYSIDNKWTGKSTWNGSATQRNACKGTPLASATPVVGERLAVRLPSSVIPSTGVVNLCMASTGSSQVRFASTESTNKPQLTLDSTPSTVVMTLQDATLTDSSSWAQSRVTSGVRWTNQDRTYQRPAALAIGPDGQTLAELTMTGDGVTNVDPEDAATAVLDAPLGTCGELSLRCPYVYVEDGGGNLDVRSSVSVSRFVEPAVDTALVGQQLSATTESWTFTYPASDLNAKRTVGPDSEGLLVDPVSGRMYVILKNKLGLASGATSWGIYAAPTEANDAPGSYPLTKIATTKLEVTGAAWSADGTEIALRTYKNVYVYKLALADVATALATSPLVLTPPTMPQGEGVSFSTDGQAVELSSEHHSGATPASVIRAPLTVGYWVSPATPGD